MSSGRGCRPCSRTACAITPFRAWRKRRRNSGKPSRTTLTAAGPWVLIELAPGSYKVHATGQKGAYAKDFDLAVKANGQTAKTIRLP